MPKNSTERAEILVRLRALIEVLDGCSDSEIQSVVYALQDATRDAYVAIRPALGSVEWRDELFSTGTDSDSESAGSAD